MNKCGTRSRTTVQVVTAVLVLFSSTGKCTPINEATFSFSAHRGTEYDICRTSIKNATAKLLYDVQFLDHVMSCK